MARVSARLTPAPRLEAGAGGENRKAENLEWSKTKTHEKPKTTAVTKTENRRNTGGEPPRAPPSPTPKKALGARVRSKRTAEQRLKHEKPPKKTPRRGVKLRVGETHTRKSPSPPRNANKWGKSKRRVAPRAGQPAPPARARFSRMKRGGRGLVPAVRFSLLTQK